MGLYNTVRASEKAQGFMPTSSLNRIRMDRQMAMSNAWQQWIGLPEGALLRSRHRMPHVSVQSFPHFDIDPICPCERRRARVPELHARAGSSRSTGPWWPDCGHSEDGVPHAEDLVSTTKFLDDQTRRARASHAERSSLEVSSVLATTPQTPPM
mgnify:CR=1 FL=1